jgi:hypothetical protein
MKTRHEIETLKAEALKALKAHQTTGLAGFKQQAVDRLRAMGINATMAHETERLIATLEERW